MSFLCVLGGGWKVRVFLSKIYFWCIGMLWLAKSYTEHERALIESQVQAFLDEMNWAATMHQADVFSKQLLHLRNNHLCQALCIYQLMLR